MTLAILWLDQQFGMLRHKIYFLATTGRATILSALSAEENLSDKQLTVHGNV